MDDLETLKVIKEKEESVNSLLASLKSEKEKELAEAENSLKLHVKAREEELQLGMEREIEEARKDALARSEIMIKDAMAKSARLKLRIKDEEIEKYLLEAIEEYLEV
ncbi:MAG: hypothetical protein M1431_06700 [Candidatus Thermoplasmatota archaeon]|nr:hypothetical protein [Candidatus Thermoplasmatota archaeon]